MTSRIFAPGRTGALLGKLTTIAALVALAGCHHTKVLSACHDSAGYQEARSAAPLKFPPGLSSPPVTTALVIPELKTPPPPPRKESEGCLDEPPPFVVPKTATPQA